MLRAPLPPLPQVQLRPVDLEAGTLLDDNAKGRRGVGGAGGGTCRPFVTRILSRLLTSALAAARKRWLSTLLLLWIAGRELIAPPSSSSSSAFRRAHRYNYAHDPVMQRNVATRGEAATRPYAAIEDLVIVCGHAVYLASDYLKVGRGLVWLRQLAAEAPRVYNFGLGLRVQRSGLWDLG